MDTNQVHSPVGVRPYGSSLGFATTVAKLYKGLAELRRECIPGQQTSGKLHIHFPNSYRMAEIDSRIIPMQTASRFVAESGLRRDLSHDERPPP